MASWRQVAASTSGREICTYNPEPELVASTITIHKHRSTLCLLIRLFILTDKLRNAFELPSSDYRGIGGIRPWTPAIHTQLYDTQALPCLSSGISHFYSVPFLEPMRAQSIPRPVHLAHSLLTNGVGHAPPTNILFTGICISLTMYPIAPITTKPTPTRRNKVSAPCVEADYVRALPA